MTKKKVVQNNTAVTIWVVVQGIHSHHVYFKSGPIGPDMRVTLDRKVGIWAPCKIRAFGLENMDNLLCEVNEQDVQGSTLLVETINEGYDVEMGELHPLYGPKQNRNSVMRHGIKSSLFSFARGITSKVRKRSILSAGRSRTDSKLSAISHGTAGSGSHASQSIAEEETPRYHFRETSEVGAMYNNFKSQQGKVVKTGLLTKQGGMVKTWHTRFFVLTTFGVQYFVDALAWTNKHRPLGSLAFEDMVIATGNTPVDAVPKTMYTLMRHSNCFCIHTTERTLTISAPSQAVMHEWMEAIRAEYNRFLEEQSLRISVLNTEREFADGVPAHGRRRAIVNVTKGDEASKNLDETLNDVIDKLLDDLEFKVIRCRNLYIMRKTMLLWRSISVASRYERALQRNATASSMVSVGSNSLNPPRRMLTSSSMVTIDDGTLVTLFPDSEPSNDLSGKVVI